MSDEKFLTMLPGMSITEQLRKEIEEAAEALGLSPSTVGARAGQGGTFYRRLCEGKRVWPETADAVRGRIAELLASGGPRGLTSSGGSV